MSCYDLPESAVIGGVERPIRSDYRAILDIIKVMSDKEIDDEERTLLVLSIFYPDFDEIPLHDFQEAIDYVYWFVGGGRDSGGRKAKPKLMDWEQDFQIIVGPVNRVLGYEVRDAEHVHWWTLLGAYYEIGDCLFAHVVSVRKKRSTGQKLDKGDKAFYQENRELIDFEDKRTQEETDTLDEWIRG